MKIFKIETDRIYDNKEQIINVMLKDNASYDDQFLKHDIVFVDSVRNIIGVIDLSFTSSQDRKDFFEVYDITDFIMGIYDDGEYKIGTEKDKEQLSYYAARY
jgi:hypothetical protein